MMIQSRARVLVSLSAAYVLGACAAATEGTESIEDELGSLSESLTSAPPTVAAKLTGAPFRRVINWDFGSQTGTVRTFADFDRLFATHDQYGTIANGTHYGAVTVATSAKTAIAAAGLGLRNDRQPVEDPAHPTREFTPDSLLVHVRPLSAQQSTVSASRHDARNGSFSSKYCPIYGGSRLGLDIVWETRVRMPKQVPGYWFALWTAGKKWDEGAEMDVVESFGAPQTPGNAFHSDAVGGWNAIDYKSWPDALDRVGVPTALRPLSAWHVWTWVYLKDDSFEVYYDGIRVQHGTLHWTLGGAKDGEPLDMAFLFDFSWGHTQVESVNVELPASLFPLTYEIDWSRVYVR